MDEAVKYIGEWQSKSVILEKLEGPTGEGRVEFPNGDSFEGYFYLHFARIQGPCYVAQGKYTFADGKYIENAWINTSSDLTMFGLKGVFEVRNADGSLASITSFCYNQRHGIEIVVSPAVEAVEWYKGEEQKRYAVANYTLNAIDEDRRELVVELADGLSITMVGGRLDKNKYDELIYENYLLGRITYTNGEIYESINYNVRNLQPYDGVGTRYQANGKMRDEYYKEYELERVEREKWNPACAVEKSIPNPINPEEKITARVWGNHIEYGYRSEMMYDGDVVDDMPYGQGIFKDVRSQAYIDGKMCDTWRFTYEGAFERGCCHGRVVFTDHEKNTTQECEWKNGLSVSATHVTLRYEWTRVLEGEYDIRTGTVEIGGVGMKCPFDGFEYIRLLEVSASQIVFTVCEPLRPGGSMCLKNELTYDLKYSLNLYWDKE
ncbi:MAG: hypothetical protein IKY75_02495 [Bacteroidaceae bacterium]|nr:hypothetical protein [Bacteroidaceae bacterium]